MMLFFVASATLAVGSEVDEKLLKLERLRQTIHALRISLSDARDQQFQLRQHLRKTELEIGEISKELRTLRQALGRQERRLKELGREKSADQRELAQYRGTLARQIVASYAVGQQGYLKIILNQQEPAAIGRTLVYYDYFTRAKVEKIAAVNETLARLQGLETQIGQEAARLRDLSREQEAKIKTHEATREERAQVLAKLDAEIATKEQQLEQLIKDEQNLARLVERLRQALQDIPPDEADIAPFERLQGQLSLPVEGALSARFGADRNVGNLKWKGVLIDANEGSEVKAVYFGRVAYADWLRGFGLLVIIDHGGGFMSLYGHNQSLYKSVGEWVGKGEVIATVGNSGGRESPGLYFEVREHGVPKNPLLWCRSGR